MNEKLERIKNHFRKNRNVYIALGFGLAGGLIVAGFTSAIVKGRYAEVQSASDTADTSVFVRPFAFLSKQTTNVVNVLERQGRGHPGYIVRCLDDGRLFTSQNEAANEAGVSSAIMSLHLRGKLDDVSGLHFERLGVFAENT